jgi:methyl-accepting chemotaxis protein
VRIADADGTVIYINDALDQVLHRDAAAFQREQPAFEADRVVGGSIGVFYADPADAAVQRLRQPCATGSAP